MADRSAFESFIGRRATVSDTATAGPIARLAATLGFQQPPSAAGDPIPPGWHTVYFGPALREEDLRPDGQARGGASMPVVPLPRFRVGLDRAEFPGTLKIGDEIRRVTEITRISEHMHPGNRTVAIVHRSEISGSEGLAVIEERESIYCEQQATIDPPIQPLPQPVWQRVVTPTPVLLFRFSALRFNSHRVHYDREFAIREERLPGLMVQAALISQLFIEMCRTAFAARRIASCTTRTHSPIYDTGPFTVSGAPDDRDGSKVTLWATDMAGTPKVTGHVGFTHS